MKRNYLQYLSTGALGLSFALGAAQLTPVLPGQSRNSDPATQQDRQKSQTFVGKIVKARNGQYAVLTDEQTGKGVYLDNQEKAKESYEAWITTDPFGC